MPTDNIATVESLRPAAVWRFFAEMSAVPRPSKNEEKIRAHIHATCDRLGFAARQDPAGNIVIEVPATTGCEHAPTIVLQGHVDMVAEKNAGIDHDFDRDPIQLVIDAAASTGEQIVRAAGTTLGADNGIGVAMALAAATDPDITHGPLELLCTSDEEMGMTGAKALEPDFIKGRTLLNLDSEEDDAIYIGCAGGCDVTLTWNPHKQPVAGDGATVKLTVTGLRGGHSGGDIHLNHANAIKLLAATLHAAEKHDLQFISIAGGSKRNAIPREASAIIAVPADAIAALTSAAAALQDAAVRSNGEAHCTITVETITPTTNHAISPDDTRRLIAGLCALPSSVLAVTPEIPGLVQTSNNVSTITTDDTLNITVGCLTRSSSADDIHNAVRQITAVGALAGATVVVGNQYPGWQPNIDSSVLAVCKRIYESLFGAAPRIAAIHAGLECGIIGERIGEIDMVSFGPHIEGAHSPDERVFIASVEKSYRYLAAVLSELATPQH
ncbi:MAG: aminoacyl-histidine dipeptidase [Phycisphaerales bacterium]|nr:aminoacyl-histidine dipeptidase [Phycisphaerales bacterium]